MNYHSGDACDFICRTSLLHSVVFIGRPFLIWYLMVEGKAVSILYHEALHLLCIDQIQANVVSGNHWSERHAFYFAVVAQLIRLVGENICTPSAMSGSNERFTTTFEWRAGWCCRVL